MSNVPSSQGQRVKVHALSHVGEIRTRNEDAIALSCAEELMTAWTGELPLDGGWALLADGLGGHVAGEVASTLAVAVMRQFMSALRAEADVVRAITEADRGLYLAMQLRPELHGMGTTIAGLVLHRDHALVLNVGDSRAYLYAEGELRQLTVDDATDGQLTQCLGGRQQCATLSPHVVQVALPSRGVLFLCSDGLTDMIDDPHVAAILSAEPANPATTLTRAALDAGGYDNVSVVSIAFGADLDTFNKDAGSVASACASSNKLTTVGFLRPCSRPLRYCCENPLASASSSWVQPFSRRRARTFSPTRRRISMPSVVAAGRLAVYQL